MARFPNQKRGDRRGRYKATKAEVAAALKEAGGLKTAAAARLGVSRMTIYKAISRWPDLADVIADAEEGLKDLAEAKVVSLIRAGDGQTVRWYLDRKARDRGYGHRQEVTGADGGPVRVRDDERSIDLSKLTFEQKKALLAAVTADNEDLES